MLRVEDRIRRLCSELLAKRGDEDVRPTLVDLREALRLHIGRMRERFGAYPFLVERRARGGTSPVNNEQEDTAKKTNPRDTCT
jgi:hypothetical protein